ncbi:MAG TPA: hypothetical protein VGM10_18695 [Actinocrinis sp.]|jgi:hypothetical protein
MPSTSPQLEPPDPQNTGAGLARRSVLLGGSTILAMGTEPREGTRAAAETATPTAGWSARVDSTGAISARTGPAPAPPVPPVVRSRQALLPTTSPSLPITQRATTFAIAQETAWLDGQHFAVGRWDGSMSVFSYETAAYQGSLISSAVNDPAAQGVQMITRLPGGVLATSNDNASLALWRSPSGTWTDLRLILPVDYDSALGAATNGAWPPRPP